MAALVFNERNRLRTAVMLSNAGKADEGNGSDRMPVAARATRNTDNRYLEEPGGKEVQPRVAGAVGVVGDFHF